MKVVRTQRKPTKVLSPKGPLGKRFGVTPLEPIAVVFDILDTVRC